MDDDAMMSLYEGCLEMSDMMFIIKKKILELFAHYLPVTWIFILSLL